jgi:hypothetical protein
LRLRLTTRLESRKKAYKKEKFFYKKSLTTYARIEYNGVSQGDTPTPPPPQGGGGGGEQIPCQRGWHASCCGAITIPYLETLRNSHNVPTIQGMLV